MAESLSTVFGLATIDLSDEPELAATFSALSFEKACLQAFRNFEERTKQTIQSSRYSNMSEAVKSSEVHLTKFQDLRDKQGKAAAVRRAVGNHLVDMQKAMDGFQIVGNLAGAFPPAMPIGVIFAACGHVLSACAGVSADYDKVEEFYRYSGRFFARITMIEDGRPKPEPFTQCIFGVFSCMLSVYARVFELASKNRFKKFLSALWVLEDPELAAGLAGVQGAIDEFIAAVGLANYAAITATQTNVELAHEKLDLLDNRIADVLGELKRDLGGVKEIIQNVTGFQTQVFANFIEVHDHMDKVEKGLKRAFTLQTELQTETIVTQLKSYMAGAVAKSQDKRAMDLKKPDKPPTSIKRDAGDKQLEAIQTMKVHFTENDDSYPQWQNALKNIGDQRAEIRENFVPGTGSWLTEDPRFKSWLSQENSVLWIQGPPGIGKSYLAHNCIEELATMTKSLEHKYMGYFFFNEDNVPAQSFHNAVACIALQVAQAHPRYAELVAVGMKQEIPIWQRFFGLRFPAAKSTTADSVDTLYVILDGLDGIPKEECELLCTSIGALKQEISNIAFLLISRPLAEPIFERLNPLTIDITKALITPDLRNVIKQRLKHLPRLRKFSLQTKRIIIRKLVIKADGMLYAEHMLRRFSYVGREKAVMDDLNRLPLDLHGLYDLLLRECQRKCSKEEHLALKKLFAWLAFSKNQMTLQEASALINLTMTHSSFDIEDEIIGRSSRILEVSRDLSLTDGQGGEDDRALDDDKEDSIEINSELSGHQRSTLTFQDRPLRQYFRLIATDSEDEMRTSAQTAHLTILEMSTSIILRLSENADDADASHLGSYSSNYWYEHLHSLKLEDAPVHVMQRVVKVLHQFISNKANLTKTLELYADSNETYGEIGGSTKSWAQVALRWIQSAVETPDAIPFELLDWAKGLLSGGVSPLSQLSRGHVMNWFRGETTWAIVESFKFAHKSLLADSQLKSYSSRKQQIFLVANHFTDISEDWRKLRAIGATLQRYQAYDWDFEPYSKDNTDGTSETKHEELKSTGLSPDTESQDEVEKPRTDLEGLVDLDTRGKATASSCLLEAIEKMANATGLDYFYTYWLLAKTYDVQDESAEKAIKATDDALNSLNGTDIAAVKEHVQEVKILKADCLKLVRKDEALVIYDEARKEADDMGLDGYSLEKMILTVEDDALLETLKSWTDKERSNYCSSIIGPWWSEAEAIERLIKVAKASGESGIKFVSDMLHRYQRTTSPQSALEVNIQAQLAKFQHAATGNDTQAKELYRDALNTKVVSADSIFGIDWLYSQVRMSLAQLIFAQFSGDVSQKSKQGYLKEFKEIPMRNQKDDFLGESHLGLLLAIMLRAIGSIVEFEVQLDKIFNKCVEGLSDDISWNDGASLRLLGKVLGLVSGLERDAMIAVSAQLYLLDPSTNAESTDSTKTDFIETADHCDNNGSGSLEGGSAETMGVIINDKNGGLNPATADSILPPSISPQQALSPQLPLDNGSAELSRPLDTSRGIVDIDEKAAAVESVTTNPKKPEQPESFDAVGGSVTCNGSSDGSCVSSGENWENPFYLCIQCTSLDLCELCYEKRMSLNRGEAVDGWKVCCAKDHVYIKGPVPGWKGIKNGNMYIGEEVILFKTWLKELQEVKWKNAWETFWRQQGALRTIAI